MITEFMSDEQRKFCEEVKAAIPDIRYAAEGEVIVFGWKYKTDRGVIVQRLYCTDNMADDPNSVKSIVKMIQKTRDEDTAMIAAGDYSFVS